MRPPVILSLIRSRRNESVLENRCLGRSSETARLNITGSSLQRTRDSSPGATSVEFVLRLDRAPPTSTFSTLPPPPVRHFPRSLHVKQSVWIFEAGLGRDAHNIQICLRVESAFVVRPILMLIANETIISP
ncbi:hypothetical protein DFH09DRAFT_1094055 [Mycena vulgaris]|nr:hypothetical protein DFH09DRAFT_1099774 [Mycena vulgaris]KAJ6529480.1 hypothetical protein DFH09DRAFT_1094055 [Mycena vulgaris]